MGDGVVLVVDDDPDTRELLRVLLQGFPDVRAVLAAKGEEALRFAHEIKPVLIILDLVLPDVEGLEVARRLNADPATQSIPVIAVTARIQARDAALQAGCVEFVEKPFDLDYFIAMMRRYLQR